MPKNTRFIISTVTILMACTLAACVQHVTEETQALSAGKKTVQKKQHVNIGDLNAKSIGKPSASISFTHAFRTPPKAGQFSVLELRIAQAYKKGSLTLTANGDSDDLEIHAASSLTKYKMADDPDKIWDISFRPKSDGVHYINISARASWDDAPDTIRTYSIRVNTGGQLFEKTSSAEILGSGETAVILEAEETIAD